MTRAEFLARWRQRRDDFDRLTAAVEGRALLDAVLGDLELVFAQEEEFGLTLRDAARESGYSVDHLARLVREGTIPNAGRPRAPRIRRKDLPRKASSLPAKRPSPHLAGATPEQIARSVVTSSQGATR
jgi:hypothetical protein